MKCEMSACGSAFRRSWKATRCLWNARRPAVYSADSAHEKTWRVDQVRWTEARVEAFAGMHNEARRMRIRCKAQRGWSKKLSTVLDDFSRYIIAWKLCPTMRAEDVTATLDLAPKVSGLDQAAARNAAASDGRRR
jgi:transposase InsO family protein